MTIISSIALLNLMLAACGGAKEVPVTVPADAQAGDLVGLEPCYGYQWWSSRVGDHYFNYASGHGGNYIILLHDLDMVIVTIADPLHDMWDGDPWKYEGAINRLVGRFIKSLPKE